MAPFGMTRMRAYKPDEEGVDVFRVRLVPSIRVVGQTDMVRRFINAPETQKVTRTASTETATATLTLNFRPRWRLDNPPAPSVRRRRCRRRCRRARRGVVALRCGSGFPSASDDIGVEPAGAHVAPHL